MTKTEARRPEPVIDRTDKGGSLGALMLLALGLVAATAAFALMRKEQAEPYILGLLGVLAVVGVFSLFAMAIGLLRFISKTHRNPLAESFMNSLDDGVLLADHNGRIIYANQSYAELTGARGPADVRTVERVFSSDPDAADAIFRLSQAVRSGRYATEEVRLPNAVGEVAAVRAGTVLA